MPKNPEKKLQNDAKNDRVTTHFFNLSTSVAAQNESSPDGNITSLAAETLKSLKGKNTYQKQKVIGQGGMGTVQQVSDSHCLRTLALKTLHKACNSKEAYIRFTEEVQITAQLEHPNIIPVYEMGLDQDKQIYYTMKLIKGRNLKEILKEIKDQNNDIIEEFPLNRLLEIFLNICDAMAYACSHKVIHRDIKPENVMIGDFGEVYLVDWGLAKIIDSKEQEQEDATSYPAERVIDPSQTQNIIQQLKKIKSLRNNIDSNLSMNNVIVGTPHYMAPERFTGQADEISEVYALGSMLYNILTLNLTIDSTDVEVIVEEIICGNIKAPNQCKNKLSHLKQGKVPPALAAIALKALSPDREHRYQTIEALHQDISRWQSGFVTQAENAGLKQILWLAIKRHKFESLITLGAMFFLIAIYLFFFIKIDHQKKLFNEAKTNALDNRLLIEQQSSELKVNSSLVEEKIRELKTVANQFQNSSRKALESFKVDKALNMINTAISINPKPRFLREKAFLLLLKNDFPNAILNFQISQDFFEKNADIIDSLNSMDLEVRRNSLSANTLLQLRSLVLKNNRIHDAAIYNQRISNNNKSLLRSVINNLQMTASFQFIRQEHISIDDKGYFTLNTPYQSIGDIEALKGIPFKSINLDGNPIKDLSALQDMPLNELYISKTLIEDLSPLSALPLSIIIAAETPISSITPLSELPLRKLILPFSKLSTLDNIPTQFLQELSIAGTGVNDLSELANAQSLRVLDLTSSKVHSLKDITTLQLSEILISNTQITDLGPIRNHFIHRLVADNLKVKNIEALATLPLRNLIMRNAPIEDIGALKDHLLEELIISGTKVTDISIINGMPLKVLDLENTPITKINVFKSLKTLKNLNLSSTNISKLPDLSQGKLELVNLQGLTIQNLDGLQKASIDKLILDRSLVKSLSAIQGKRFQELSLKSCDLRSLDILKGIKATSLDLANNSIDDIKLISQLPVSHLFLTNNPIEDISPLENKPLLSLKLNNTKVKNITPLANMPLTLLDLEKTPITDFSTLKTLIKIKELNLKRTKFNALNDLALYNLIRLNIEECKHINDYYRLKWAVNLEELHLSSKVKNLTFLKSLKAIKKISNEKEPGFLNKEAYLLKYSQGEMK